MGLESGSGSDPNADAMRLGHFAPSGKRKDRRKHRTLPIGRALGPANKGLADWAGRCMPWLQLVSRGHQSLSLFFAPEHYSLSILSLNPVEEFLALAVPQVRRRRELGHRKIKPNTVGYDEFTFFGGHHVV